MRIYLSGPMSGIEDNNRPAFRAAAVELRGMGHEVYNPADHGLTLSYREYLTMDMVWIGRKAEAIAMLPGWLSSPGAQAEYAFAVALNLGLYSWPGDKAKLGALSMAKGDGTLNLSKGQSFSAGVLGEPKGDER